MALSRVSSASDLLTAFSRVSHAAIGSLGEMQRTTRYAAVHQSRVKGLHVTSVRRYPEAPAIPLPMNVSEIFANETGRFTPERSRDIAAPVLIYASRHHGPFGKNERSDFHAIPVDTHVDSYDCFGAVSLNGSMQSNVPKPFCSRGKSTHLNMPGGEWARDGKYIAEDMQNSHYRAVRLPRLKCTNGAGLNIRITSPFLQITYRQKDIIRGYATEAPKSLENETKEQSENSAKLSKRERFKVAMRDYGSTVVFFHVGISLISLGACYTAVISGLDLLPIVRAVTNVTGGGENLQNVLATSSSFVFAYAIHKCFAPLRISITLAAVPIIVHRLRKMGILKPPKAK